MTEETDRLVWVDVETTGLDPDVDRILELGVIITDGELEPIAAMHTMFNVGLSRVKMTEAVWKMHTDNGLLDEIRTREGQYPPRIASMFDVPHFGELPGSFLTAGLNEVSYTETYREFMGLIRTHGAVGAPLAGSSVAFDRAMLKSAGFVAALDLLHYRNFDVSVFREALRRWLPEITLPPKSERHRVFDDLAVSIETARLMRKLLAQEDIVLGIKTDPMAMIEEWRESKSLRELHSFMGWTRSDYRHWMETDEPPAFLPPDPDPAEWPPFHGPMSDEDPDPEPAPEIVRDPDTAPLDVDQETQPKIDPPRCSATCEHGSRCILPSDHQPPDRHETEHGCICYDPKTPSDDGADPETTSTASNPFDPDKGDIPF